MGRPVPWWRNLLAGGESSRRTKVSQWATTYLEQLGEWENTSGLSGAVLWQRELAEHPQVLSFLLVNFGHLMIANGTWTVAGDLFAAGMAAGIGLMRTDTEPNAELIAQAAQRYQRLSQEDRVRDGETYWRSILALETSIGLRYDALVELEDTRNPGAAATAFIELWCEQADPARLSQPACERRKDTPRTPTAEEAAAKLRDLIRSFYTTALMAGARAILEGRARDQRA